MKLAGKVAFVTGAARGIGRGCALELARSGADLVVNDLQASDETESLIRDLEGLGRRAALVTGDVFQRESCEQVAEQAARQLGPIDIFISNPAFSKRTPFLEYDPEIFQRTIAGTLTAGFHMSQLVARQMVARQARGKMVFISSLHARVPFVNAVAYNAAKRGVIAMMETIAAELLPHRINVNAIEPGWIDTPGERATFGDDAVDSGGDQLPWGRLGRPEDIGRAAVFLASDDADYITGISLLVDGGLWLRAATPAVSPGGD